MSRRWRIGRRGRSGRSRATRARSRRSRLRNRRTTARCLLRRTSRSIGLWRRRFLRRSSREVVDAAARRVDLGDGFHRCGHAAGHVSVDDERRRSLLWVARFFFRGGLGAGRFEVEELGACCFGSFAVLDVFVDAVGRYAD